MNIIVLLLTSASLFSIEGLGQDVAVFHGPFTHVDKYTRIEFVLRPEWTVLKEGSEIRSIFWSNPFRFLLAAPVYKGFAVAAGNQERFNQSFDVFLENDDLTLHVLSRGGVEEVFATVGYTHGLGEIAIRGSYLFGNTCESWDYIIENYNLVDTFLYKYTGAIFSAGIHFTYVSIYYETFGSLDMTKPLMDTTFDLPNRLGLGVHGPVLGGQLSGIYEYSWWNDMYDFTRVHRFKILYTSDRYSIGYRYNPWYLERVTEHGLDLSYAIPLRYLGTIRLRAECSLRQTESVQEFIIAPQIELTIKELFVRRRR